MNLKPTQVKDKAGKVVDAHEAVCEVCDGNNFHIVIINGHNHLICSNPVCGESYCQGGCSPQYKRGDVVKFESEELGKGIAEILFQCSNGTQYSAKRLNIPNDEAGNCTLNASDIVGFYDDSDHPQENCSYCGSGLMKDGECQKCGL